MKFQAIEVIWRLTMLFVSTILSAQPALTNDQFIVLDGHKTHYQSGGNGPVTVVFESGYGDNLSSWNSIYSEVGSFAKVFRYDREGLGLSESVAPNQQPKDFKQIARRLHELLKSASINPPYVLTAHSFGGEVARAFATLYPDEVQGLVLVDAQNEFTGSDLTRQQKIDDEEVKEMDKKMSTMNGTGRYAEWEIAKREYINGYLELSSFGFLNVPTVILAAGGGGLKNGLYRLYKEKMKELSQAYYIEVANSHHYVHIYEPFVVIENIRRVVFSFLEKSLKNSLQENGVDSCVALFIKLRTIYPREYVLERYLNRFGSEELNLGHVQEAIKLFTLNAETFPQSSNAFESLADAYLKAGNKSEAATNYKKSLALNPENFYAQDQLRKLR